MAASRRWPKNWFAGILYVRFVIPLEVRGSKRRRSGDLAPYDISNELCWADQSKETCCQGDATSHAECWDESYSFEECCPNADCWDGKLFTYEACCDQKHGENGNPGCWSGYYDYEHCCLANRSSQSWVDIILREIDTDQFYGMDEFYTDSQYGNDFGYYSTGRVLGKSDGKTAQEFAHYTTYPMALSPHFGRVLCRLVFIMWIQMKEKAPFRVVEMGAGSGQLAHDIHVCVKHNELGIEPAVWRRFVGAFEYVIVERSPALARRQRERGLKVVNGDAQRKDSCPSVLRALASSDACSAAFSSAPECQVSDRADKHTAASVVLSNELLDAFAPVKLQLSIYGQPVVTHCRAWQEIRMVHIIKLKDLESISQALHHSEERISAMAMDLEGYTNEVFCRVTNTSVGQAAMACAPTSSCLAMVIALSEIMNHHDLHLPAAAHNMRLRLRKDAELCQRLQGMVSELEENFQNSVVLPRQVYRMLRHQLREAVDLELLFLTSATTRQVPVPLSERRCEDLKWWFEVHEARIQRLIDIYRPLGYPNIQLLLRPGERNFVELVDCLIGKEGFMLAVDYGATFEELQHVSTRLTQATIYMIMVAAALSTAVARATAGNYQLFQPTWAEDILQSIEGGSVDKILGKKMWMLIAIPIAVACSLCGFVISKSTSVLHRLVQKYRPLAPLPVAFALQALITASFGALVFRTTGLRGVWGIGAESLQIAMTKTVPLGHLLLFAIGKGLALILGMAVRCPADMLEPVLITGGFLGGAIGSLLPQEDTELLQGGTVMPCIIFGMVGLFASCFRFSLTPIVIVLEIVGTESYSLILPAVLCGFTASTCSDHLFPALLEDILEQDGINLQELAEQAEETFEADDAAREREESEEESVETNGRSMNRHGTSKSHKSRHSGSAPSEGSDRAMSRQNSEAPLSFLRRGLEESLYQQSTAKTKSRTVTIRDGANLLSRSNSHRYHPQSQRHSLPELTSESLCGRLAESGGKIEIPLQGLRNPVDLRFQVHEVVDGDGHHKYFLQVSNSQSPTRGPYRAQSSCKDFEHAGCRSQSLLSVNEERPQQPGEDGLVQTHEASQDEPPVSLHIERQES